MRRTQILFKQHIGWHFEKHWRVQGRKKIINTGAEKVLREKGIPIVDENEFIFKKKPIEKVEVVGLQEKPIKFDHTHPDWHETPLLTYKDNNVLLEGLSQAKLLTNTVELQDGLPTSLSLQDVSKDFNDRVRKIIMGSHVFDAEQQKLPKIKDPERPAYNFPRVYGITKNRVNKLLISKLLQLIEMTSDYNLVKSRQILNDLHFILPFEKGDNTVQFQLTADFMVLSKQPLSNITSDSAENVALPDLFPLAPTVSLSKENIYTIGNLYPLKNQFAELYPHTVFIVYNDEEVKNLYEEPVEEHQIFGRSLLKTYTVAASYARKKYGNDVGTLSQPISVQCVQTDGKKFHFGVLQLNTLDSEDKSKKNVWYQTKMLPFFETCAYQQGRPVLEGYNHEVVRHIRAFYENV